MTMFSIIPASGTTRAIAGARLRCVSTWITWIAIGIVAIGFAPVHAQTAGLPVIVADFNQDGIPDALLPSTTAPTATIALGSVPYGTFSSSAKALALPAACTGAAAGTLLVGDFNADGFPDIAFFCGGGATSSGVLLGNGDGTFAPAKTFGGAFSANAVLGDFNHDGKLDIAVIGPNSANSTQQGILFLPGNGDGTFGDPTFTAFAAGSSYSSPLAVDVDQDGYPDIVVGSFGGDSGPTLNVFGNNKDGTFGVAGRGSSTPNASIAVGAGGSIDQSILTGNFFGTGKPDFAVPDTGSTPGIWVVKNTSTSGAFSLAAAVETAYPALQGAMVGTFTGSGFSDLIAANGTALTVLANDGTGSFTADYATLTLPFTSTQFAVADANGDGYTDVYTATAPNAAVQISVNLVSGSASATSQPFSLGAGTKAVSAAWPGNVNFTGSTASGTQTVPPGSSPVAPTLTWAAPAAIDYGTPLSATQLDATATNASGASIPGTYVYTPSAGAVLNPGTQTLSVTFTPTDTATYTTASKSVSLTVNAPPASVTLSGPPTTPPGTQPTLSLIVDNPYPIDVTAVLTLTFAASSSPSVDDPAVQFASGGRTYSFVLPANTTTTPPILLQSGTDAGTITATLQLLAGTVDVTPASQQPVNIEIPDSVPIISSVSINRTANQLTLVIQGYSDTRELSQANFVFTGTKLINSNITAPVTPAFTTWYGSPDSIQYGSTFTYTQLFDVAGDITDIQSVQVTLANAVGASTPKTAQ